MPRDTSNPKGPLKAKAGVAMVTAPPPPDSAAAAVVPVPTPPFAVVATSAPGGMYAPCDTCGLNLPRSADHADVKAHPCFRGLTVTLTAAGQLSLA